MYKSMEEERWPKLLYQWKPNRKRKRGRTKTTWKTNITTAKRAIRLNIEDVYD